MSDWQKSDWQANAASDDSREAQEGISISLREAQEVIRAQREQIRMLKGLCVTVLRTYANRRDSLESDWRANWQTQWLESAWPEFEEALKGK